MHSALGLPSWEVVYWLLAFQLKQVNIYTLWFTSVHFEFLFGSHFLNTPTSDSVWSCVVYLFRNTESVPAPKGRLGTVIRSRALDDRHVLYLDKQ